MHLYMHPSVDIISRGSLTQGKVSFLLRAILQVLSIFTQTLHSQAALTHDAILMMRSHHFLLTCLTNRLQLCRLLFENIEVNLSAFCSSYISTNTHHRRGLSQAFMEKLQLQLLFVIPPYHNKFQFYHQREHSCLTLMHRKRSRQLERELYK